VSLGLLPAARGGAASPGLAVGVGQGPDVGVGPGGEGADGGLGRGAAGLREGGPQARLLEEVGGLSEPAAGEVGRRCAQGGAGGRVEELTVEVFVVVVVERVERAR